MPVPKKTSAETLSLRITVVDPPPNILWALQLGREEIAKPTSNTKNRICFGRDAADLLQPLFAQMSQPYKRTESAKIPQ